MVPEVIFSRKKSLKIKHFEFVALNFRIAKFKKQNLKHLRCIVFMIYNESCGLYQNFLQLFFSKLTFTPKMQNCISVKLIVLLVKAHTILKQG